MNSMMRRLLVGISVFSAFGSLKAQWVQARGPYHNPGSPIAVDSNIVYVAYPVAEVARSMDDGTSWTSLPQILPRSGIVNSLTIMGTDIFAGTTHGVYLSGNSGSSWTAVNNGLPAVISVQTIVVSSDSTEDLFAGTNHGVFLSTNDGSDWSPVNAGLTDTTVNCLLFSGTRLYAGTDSGLFSTSDNGLKWVRSGSGPTPDSINCLASNGTSLYAGTDSGVFMSTDGGNNWIANGLSGELTRTLAFKDSTLFAGTDDGLFFSVNDGSSWSDGHLPTSVFFIAVEGNNLFVSGSGGIFLSTDNALSWKCLSGQTSETELKFARRNNDLFVGTNFGVFHSTDNGESWLPAGLPDFSVSSLSFKDSSLFAYTGKGTFVSTDDGMDWKALNLPVNITSFLVDGQDLYVSTVDDSIFVSTDNGSSWMRIGDGIPSVSIGGFIADPDSSNVIYAWSSYDGVFKSTNSGVTWVPADSGLPPNTINAVTFGGESLYAGTGSGVYVTNDHGASWNSVNLALTNEYITTVATDTSLPGKIFAGGYNGALVLTTNSGIPLVYVNKGLPSYDVYALTVCGANLVAGTNGSNVYYRPLSQILTSVNRPGSDIPADFRLDQNYPNPFNPTTAISYRLSTISHVTLKIYDVLGREVATLVDGKETAGPHTVTWNASRFASGVYFYRLMASSPQGNFIDTKRMMLIK